jgi:hypothetical protein
MIAYNNDFPDDHHPHVDVKVVPGNVAEIPKWLAENTTGAYQMVYVNGAVDSRNPTNIAMVYRFHFVEERDAVLFKTFFG